MQTDAEITPAEGGFVPPYPPSWVDRLMDAVDGWPWPWWLSYLGMTLVAFLAVVLVQIWTGGYHPGSLVWFHLWVTGYFAYLLALLHGLDRSAVGALQTFRPVLTFDRDDSDEVTGLEDLKYRLATMPPRPLLIAAVLGVLISTGIPLLTFGTVGTGGVLVDAAVQFHFSTHPVSLAMLVLSSVLSSIIAGGFVYHTVHQLRLIDHIYRHHTEVNLYRLSPLFSFSRTTALTAIGLILFDYTFFGTGPALASQPVSIALAVFFLIVAAVTFVWPLYGAHRQLVDEKRRLISEASGRFEAATHELHRRVDDGEWERVDQVNKAMSGLDVELAALRRIPTWPWEAGTLRGMITALLLPVVIWLIQYILGRWLQ